MKDITLNINSFYHWDERRLLTRALNFARDEFFKTSAEFIIEAFNCETCFNYFESLLDEYKNKYRLSIYEIENEKEFTELEEANYLFTKAFIFCFSKDSIYLSIAKESIKKVQTYVDWGFEYYEESVFIEGLIYLKMLNYDEALKCFLECSEVYNIKHIQNFRVEYYLALTFMNLNLNLNIGFIHSLHSYLYKPCLCSALLLKSYYDKAGIELDYTDEFKENEIIRTFIQKENWLQFEDTYLKCMYQLPPKKYDSKTSIDDFVLCIFGFLGKVYLEYEIISDNAFEKSEDSEEEHEYGSSNEKYGGYNDFSDDVIDDAFDGNPMNTLGHD
jgi:tetratricopeptide (TPR) repeat protein